MKYLPGLMVGQLSGSTGSTTASHNSQGSYFRSKVKPVNPNTTAQNFVRDRFALPSESWRGLTDAQRQGWKSLGAQMTAVDALGNPYTLNGFQAYMSVNRYRLQLNLTVLSSAPALTSASWLTALGPIVADSVVPTFTVAFTPTPVPANSYLLIRATRPISPGRSFIGPTQYRNMFTVNPAGASPADILANYTARFGTLIAGYKVGIQAVPFIANGFRGAPLTAVVTIT